MKLVKPSYQFIEQQPGMDGLYKHIELIGRTCYKSEDKITPDSAKKFVEMLIKSGHGAMLEHGTVYLAMPMETIISVEANGWGKYTKNPYSRGFKVCSVNGKKRVAVTTNFRVLVENGWLEDLEYICEPTPYHDKRYTIKFVCDRGVSHEFVRHRVMSFAQESTRYCNYSKDKFGKELTFILPCWMESDKFGLNDAAGQSFIQSMRNAEDDYFDLLEEGWKPQQARAVLPNSLKTELVMTGFVNDWKHFFELRDDKAHAHPQAYELAHPLHEEFVNKGIL